MESKRNEIFGSVIFGTNVIQRTWSARKGSFEVATRQGGVPTSPGHAPHPHGPLMAPLIDFFHLYKSTYPKNIETEDRSGVPPPQASIATKNLSGSRSDALPEGEPITGGHLHHLGALHDEEGVVHARR